MVRSWVTLICPETRLFIPFFGAAARYKTWELWEEMAEKHSGSTIQGMLWEWLIFPFLAPGVMGPAIRNITSFCGVKVK